MASVMAEKTEMLSISGGSPMALERKMEGFLFGASGRMWTLNTGATSRLHSSLTYSPRAGPTSSRFVLESSRWLRHQHTDDVGFFGPSIVATSSNSPIGASRNNQALFDEFSPYKPYMAYGRSKQRMEAALTEAQARHLTVHGAQREEDGTWVWKFDNFTGTAFTFRGRVVGDLQPSAAPAELCASPGDEDSDGGIGSTSNDNNDANNPRFGTANVFVTTDMPSPSMITLTSHATSATTALDATVQIQVLLLIRELQREFDLGVIFVTHDIGVAVEVSDRIGVMYAGKIVETGSVRDVYKNPKHPYTKDLIGAFPDIEGPQTLPAYIPGLLPSLIHPPEGCRFHPRCKYAWPLCIDREPPLDPVGEGHRAACHLNTTSPPAKGDA